MSTEHCTSAADMSRETKPKSKPMLENKTKLLAAARTAKKVLAGPLELVGILLYVPVMLLAAPLLTVVGIFGGGEMLEKYLGWQAGRDGPISLIFGLFVSWVAVAICDAAHVFGQDVIERLVFGFAAWFIVVAPAISLARLLFVCLPMQLAAYISGVYSNELKQLTKPESE